jgi:hypothetical protein
MSKKRTKSDQSQRNAERLENRYEADLEPEANVTRQEPTAAIGLEEQIRRRAYELYEARGRKGGEELKDWLQAEAEIRRRATGMTNVIPFPSARK